MTADRIDAATPAELGSSLKRLARIAGLLYLVVGIFGGFAVAYVTAAVYVPGDAATTTANVLANAGLSALAPSPICCRRQSLSSWR